MSRIIHRTLAELRFVGGRFEKLSGFLEFDVLNELIAYKSLLVEIAKQVWRRHKPDRERLRQGFEKEIRLAFRKVDPGSCVVPIERVFELKDGELPLERPSDEVDEAAAIIDGTLRAAERDLRFPDGLSKRVVPLFREWGKTLQDDEAIELDGKGADGRARFNAAIRERILSRVAGKYEDCVTIVGEVRGANLRTTDGGSFAVHLDDGSTVEGSFGPEQEAVITEALYRHKDVRIRIEGKAEFDPDGRIRKIIALDRVSPAPSLDEEYDPRARPIWEVIEELGKSVPEEEWDKIPRDAARNLDHYLYGTPKEEP